MAESLLQYYRGDDGHIYNGPSVHGTWFRWADDLGGWHQLGGKPNVSLNILSGTDALSVLRNMEANMIRRKTERGWQGGGSACT